MVGIVDEVAALDFDVAAWYALVKNEEKHHSARDDTDEPAVYVDGVRL